MPRRWKLRRAEDTGAGPGEQEGLPGEPASNPRASQASPVQAAASFYALGQKPCQVSRIWQVGTALVMCVKV